MKILSLSLLLAVVQGGRICTNPKGNDGESHTEGCLKITCKAGVWRSSIETSFCCYDRQPYFPNTTITATEDGCTSAIIFCKLEDEVATAVLQVENTCGDHSTEEQVQELKHLLVIHMEQTGALEVRAEASEDKVSVSLEVSNEILCIGKHEVEDAFSVEFETDRRGALRNLNTIQVLAYFNDTVNEDCEEDLVLNMEQPDGSWQEVETAKKIKRDRKRKSKTFFLWKVSPIVPCRTNRFRLISGENYIEAQLAPADLEDMEELEFSPGNPENIVYENNELKWDRLACATSYEVEIFNIDKGDEVRSEVINENSISLPELEYCKEFEFIIYPNVGEFESLDDEAVGEFTRGPNHDVLSALEVKAEASEDKVSVSWEVSNEILCIDKYEVEVCEANDSDICHTETVYDPLEELVFSVEIEGLKQATEYRIILTALYRGNAYYKEIKKQFNTKLG